MYASEIERLRKTGIASRHMGSIERDHRILPAMEQEQPDPFKQTERPIEEEMVGVAVSCHPSDGKFLFLSRVEKERR